MKDISEAKNELKIVMQHFGSQLWENGPSSNYTISVPSERSGVQGVPNMREIPWELVAELKDNPHIDITAFLDRQKKDRHKKSKAAENRSTLTNKGKGKLRRRTTERQDGR